MSSEPSKLDIATKLALSQSDLLDSRFGIAALRDLVSKVSTPDDSDIVMRREIMLTDMIVRTVQLGTTVKSDVLRPAIDAVIERLERTPIVPERWNTLGLLAYGAGDVHLATTAFQAALRLDEDYPTVRENLDRARATTQRGARSLADLDMRIKRMRREVHNFHSEKQTPTLTLAMIVKNEESMLPACLGSVEGIVDEIIVVDTGSTDRTVEIAKDFGAVVLHHPWTHDFAEARNVGIDAATSDWVMVLDADERIHPDDAPNIKAHLVREWREYFNIAIHNYSGSGEYTTVMDQARIWKRSSNRRYQGRIHEQVMWSLPQPMHVYSETLPVRVLHYGYLKEVLVAKKKSERNLVPLLEQERERGPEPFNDYNLGVEYLQLEKYEQSASYFERSWDALKDLPGGPIVGYTGMLTTYLARAYRLASRYADADAFLEEATDVLPGHTDLVLERALVAQRSGDLSSATTFARKALKMGDTPAGYGGALGAGTFLPLLLLGEIALQNDDIETSIELTSKALFEYDYQGATRALVRLRRTRGDDPQQIVDDLRELADKHPSTVGILLANALYEHRDIDAAQAEYQCLADRGLHHHPVIRIGLLECALSNGDLAFVMENTTMDDESDPLLERLWHFRVFAAFASGDTEDLDRLTSLPVFDRLPAPFQAAAHALTGKPLQIQEAPNSVAVLDQFLRSTLRLQLIEPSSSLIQILAGSLPVAVRSALLAETFLDCGYLDSAADEFASWITATGPSVRNLTGLAKLEVAMGRPENAAEIAEDILQLDPANHVALKLRMER